MSPTVQTTTTTEVKLAPAVRRKVLTELKTFAELHAQKKALEHAIDGSKTKVQQLFEAAGELDALIAGISIEGFKTKMVQGSRTDKKTFEKVLIGLGVTAEMLGEAKDKAQRPNKPYLKITAPGEEEHEYGSM